MPTKYIVMWPERRAETAYLIYIPDGKHDADYFWSAASIFLGQDFAKIVHFSSREEADAVAFAQIVRRPNLMGRICVVECGPELCEGCKSSP